MTTIRKLISNLHLTFYPYFSNEYFTYFLLTIALILVINPNHLNYQLYDMDEIWNYQWARHILYGNIPSKDFMLLVPLPFSSQINGHLLSIFGDKLIVMRWIASMAAVFNGLIAFRILRLIGKSNLMAFFYTVLFMFPFALYPKNNYSWYAVLFLTLALLLELNKIASEKGKQLRYEVWIGIILGLVTITKQNVGVAGLLVSIVFLIYHSRNQGKKYLVHSMFLKLMGWGAVVGIEILYLSRDVGAVFLCKKLIANMTGFTQFASVPYSSLLYSESLVLRVLAIAIPIVILFSFIKGICTKEEHRKNTIILTAFYACANLAMVIPMADWIHLNFGMPLSIIVIAVAFRDPSYDQVRQRIGFSILMLIIIMASAVFDLPDDYPTLTEPEIKHFESIDLPLETKNKIIDMDNYIIDEESKGKTVYFLNFAASRYLIPIDKFGYLYDGIVGSGSIGERETIEKLSSAKNVTVIIRGINSPKNWQETTEVENYVRENMQYKTTLHEFDIYSR